MGNKGSTAAASPLDLYARGSRLHQRGEVIGFAQLMQDTAEKMLTSGLLAWQIAGRIDSADDDRAPLGSQQQGPSKVVEDPWEPESEGLLRLHEEEDVRAEVLLERKQRNSNAPATAADPPSETKGRVHFSDTTPDGPAVPDAAVGTNLDYPGFIIPTAVQDLADLVASCSHASCKQAFLCISKALATTQAHTPNQRTDNQKAFAEVTCQACVAALRLSVHGEELVGICDAIRLYSRLNAFRKDFIFENGCGLLRGKLSVVRKKRWLCASGPAQTRLSDGAAALPVSAALRSILSDEVASGGASAVLRIADANDLPGFAASIVVLRECDNTLFTELATMDTLIAAAAGSSEGHRVMAETAVAVLMGHDGWDPNPATVLCALQSLCTGMWESTHDLLGLGLERLVEVVTRVVVLYAYADVLLFHIVILMDRIVASVLRRDEEARLVAQESTQSFKTTTPAGNHQVESSIITKTLECLASIMSRLVACVETVADPLAECLAKVCYLTRQFADHPEHRCLLAASGCLYIAARYVIHNPDLPEWILVPCIQLVCVLPDAEPAVPLGVPTLKQCDTVPDLCRLLSSAKHNISLNVKTILAVLSTLHELCREEATTELVFNAIGVVEIWMWCNLAVHIQKEAERKVLRKWLKAARTQVEGAMLAKAGKRELRQTVLRSANSRVEQRQKARENWAAFGAQLPRNIVWESEEMYREVCFEDDIEEVSRMARALRDRLQEAGSVAEYNRKYEDRAQKLQQWYRKKRAVATIWRTTNEKSKERVACVAIQRVWRGHCARKVHARKLLQETTRRNAACVVQRRWRRYLSDREKETDSMFEFVLEKLDLAPIPLVEPELSRNRTVVHSKVVDLLDWNFDNLVLPLDPSLRKYTLVFWYTPRSMRCSGVHITLEKMALTFRDFDNVLIGRVNGEECEELVQRFRVPCFPFLMWVTPENVVEEYTAEWPKKPMSIRQLVENFMALQIQRMWRGKRVQRRYAELMKRVRHENDLAKRKRMQYVCQVGDVDGLAELLDTVSPDKLTDTGELPLNLAIKHGQKDIFAVLINAGADLDAADRFGHSPIFYAAAGGLTEVVSMLIKKHVTLTRVDHLQRNVMHTACENGHDAVVTLLLNLGLDTLIAQKDVSDYTPLDYAITSGLEHVSMQLLLKGVPARRDMEQRLIFHALITGMQSIVSVVIQQGLIDLEKDDETPQRWAPLHYAAASGQVKMLKALLDTGLSPSPRTAGGQTPLHLAAKSGHAPCVEMLYSAMHLPARELLQSTHEEHEAFDEGDFFARSPNKVVYGPFVDDCGCTVLHYAASQPELAVFSERLIKELNSTEIPGANLAGNTPLHFAASRGLYFVAFHLARKLVATDVCDAINSHGNTALHLAAMHGHRELTLMLISMGADMTITDPDYNSLLHFAVASRHFRDVSEKVALIRSLIGVEKHPTDPANASGQTPLHLACARGLMPVVEELVLRAEDEVRPVLINRRDTVGNTPLHFACDRGRRETTKSMPNYPFNNAMIFLLIAEGGDHLLENKDGITPEDLIPQKGLVKRALAVRAERLEERKILKLLEET